MIVVYDFIDVSKLCLTNKHYYYYFHLFIYLLKNTRFISNGYIQSDSEILTWLKLF